MASVLWGQDQLYRRTIARAIPRATRVTFDDLGHSPQVQDSTRFNAALLKTLSSAK
jgi:pimeloyl-ACP methyl ester carboxylesterase